MSDIPPLYCANHPNVETGLRCNNCNKPICPKCAKLTPTGYRCKDCLRNQQRNFDTTEWYDPLLAFFLAAILSFIGSLLVSVLGFFTLFVAPIAGVIIAEGVRFVVRRRRSSQLYVAAVVGAVLGSLPHLLMAIFATIGGMGFGGIWDLIWHGYYTFTVTSTILYRLRGIRLG